MTDREHQARADRWTVAIAASVLLVAAAGSSGAQDPSLKEFFRPAPDLAASSPPDKVYPQGRIFPMTMFSVGGISGGKAPEKDLQAALKRYKAYGFTMMGPQYELNDRILDDAKAQGLKVLYTVGMPLKFHAKPPPEFTAQDVEKAIKTQVLKVARDPQIGWWYLQPEELRYWRKNEMMYLETAADTIRRTDPLKRPVWMYDPGHRVAEGLSHTAKRLDLCGKGLYTNYSGQRDSRIWVRWSIEQEIEGIKQSGASAIPIAVPEMFQQPDPEHLVMIPKWVRHDVYLSLVAGAKGVVVFSLRKRPKFAAHEAYYSAYGQVARELCQTPGLGQVFLFGERRKDIRVEVLEGPKQIAPKEGTGGIRPPARKYLPASILDVAHKTGRYLFTVNSANVPVRIRVKGLPDEKILGEDVFGSTQPLEIKQGTFELQFDPLDVKAIRFRPAGGRESKPD